MVFPLWKSRVKELRVGRRVSRAREELRAARRPRQALSTPTPISNARPPPPPPSVRSGGDAGQRPLRSCAAERQGLEGKAPSSGEGERKI